MKKQTLSDFVIMSDVDGTLLAHDGTIPERNLAALNRFTQKGGRFALATGRSPVHLGHIVQQLPINFPCVVFNGGALFDYSTNTELMRRELPPQAEEYILKMQGSLSPCTAVVVSDVYYQLTEEDKIASAFKDQKRYYIPQPDPNKIPRPWYKAVFYTNEQNYERFYQLAEEFAFEGVRFVATNTKMHEMLPEGCSKATALEQLLKKKDISRKNLVCIGDFFNDLEMIQYAGIGVTLSDSPQALKDAADLVVGTCQQGALADLVEHLEALCD